MSLFWYIAMPLLAFVSAVAIALGFSYIIWLAIKNDKNNENKE